MKGFEEKLLARLFTSESLQVSIYYVTDKRGGNFSFAVFCAADTMRSVESTKAGEWGKWVKSTQPLYLSLLSDKSDQENDEVITHIFNF